MANKVRTGDRSNLKIADLMRRPQTTTKLMNVKVPWHILEAIEHMANELDTTKTAVVIALLEAGLAGTGKLQAKRQK